MGSSIVIEAEICGLRPWADGDVESLAAIANDNEIARYLRDRFPHPYTLDDARAWVDLNRARIPVDHFAITVQGRLAGAIGIERHEGERRGTMEIGYWIGRDFRGRGVATAACRALTTHLFAETDVRRIEAAVLVPNVASARVLEYCGYLREGLMRSAIAKGGDVYDAYLYARIRE